MTRLKIVRDSDPNEDGEWVDVERDIPFQTSRKWLDTVLFFQDLVPVGFHMVAFERVKS